MRGVGDGFDMAMSWINWRRMCRTRRSGGRPIADLQAVQHLFADMDADIYTARAAALVAQAELDELGPFAVPLHHDAPRLISLIKVINDEAFFRVAGRAVQIHGGTPLLLGSPDEKLFRVARNRKIPAGTVEIQRNAVARPAGVIRPGVTRPG